MTGGIKGLWNRLSPLLEPCPFHLQAPLLNEPCGFFPVLVAQPWGSIIDPWQRDLSHHLKPLMCVCVCVRLLADSPLQGCCQARSGPGMPQSLTGLQSSLLLPVKALRRRTLLLYGFVLARGGRTVAIDAAVLNRGFHAPGGNGFEKKMGSYMPEYPEILSPWLYSIHI